MWWIKARYNDLFDNALYDFWGPLNFRLVVLPLFFFYFYFFIIIFFFFLVWCFCCCSYFYSRNLTLKLNYEKHNVCYASCLLSTVCWKIFYFFLNFLYERIGEEGVEIKSYVCSDFVPVLIIVSSHNFIKQLNGKYFF